MKAGTLAAFDEQHSAGRLEASSAPLHTWTETKPDLADWTVTDVSDWYVRVEHAHKMILYGELITRDTESCTGYDVSLCQALRMPQGSYAATESTALVYARLSLVTTICVSRLE